MYTDKELFHGPGTPVNVRSTSSKDKEFTIPAQVVLCRLKQQFPKHAANPEHAAGTSERDAVLEIKAALAHENARILSLHKPQTDSHHISTISSLLRRLLAVDITNDVLTSTKISAPVTKLKNYENKCVAKLAKTLLSKWHSVNDSSELTSSILAIRQRLESENEEHILDDMAALNNVSVTLDVLKATKIGLTVGNLKKNKNGAISMMARELVAKWKRIVNMDKEVLALKEKLEVASDNEAHLNALQALNNIDVTADTLKSTCIQPTVAALSKNKNDAIAKLAGEIIAKWEDITERTAAAATPSAEISEKCRKPSPDVSKKAVTPLFVYTIKVPHGDGSFHIEDDVALDRVTYRRGETKRQEPDDDKSKTSRAKSGVMDVDLKDGALHEKQSEGEAGVSNPDGGREQHEPRANNHSDMPTSNIQDQRCQLASPSTLSQSETTLEQPQSDSHSQQSSGKRKSNHPDRKVENAKRPSLTRVHPVWTPPARIENGAEPDLKPKQLYPTAGTEWTFDHSSPNKTAAKVAGNDNISRCQPSNIHFELASRYRSAKFNERGLYCKVNFSPWLVYDDSSRARLHRE